MDNTLTWRGGNGAWGSALDWSGLRVPGASDDVTLGASGTVSVNAGVNAAAADLTVPGDTLDVAGGGVLAVGGTIALDGGTLILGGTLDGGTLEIGGGELTGDGGTLDATVVQGGLTGLGDLTITAATAGANAGAIAPDGTLGLAAGLYDGAHFLLDPLDVAGTAAELDAAAGASVTFGTATTITLSQDAPAGMDNGSPVYGDAAGLGGGGAMLNLGTITSDFANAAQGELAISVASFTNAGTMDFAPMTTPQSLTVYEPAGKFGQSVAVAVTWTQNSAPTLDLDSASFANGGILSMEGGTLDVSAPRFANSGTIALTDATTQALLLGPGGIATIIDAPLTTQVEFGAGVADFSNSGVIEADRVQFDNALTLAGLGAVSGALVFAGTLDLGGGTLDASAYGDVTITGTVENGTIAAGSGHLTLDGATLANVSVAAGGNVAALGPITLRDPAAGSVVLNGTTTELDFSAGASVASLAVSAGDTLATDTLRMLGTGTLTLGAGFSLVAALAGSTVAVAGAGVVVNDGGFAVDAATLLVSATLAGNGTITMADGAVVTLSALAVGATPNIAFGAGPALLALPGDGAGVTLGGLQAGDILDFTSVSASGTGTGEASIGGGMLHLTGASGETASVTLAAPDTGLSFTVAADQTGGSLVTVACFRTGTRIATPGGYAPIESLDIGDFVLTPGGRPRPIKWIGRRAYAAAFVAANRQLRPVRFAVGALGKGLPRRPLEVSPLHAMLVQGVLVPAGALVNGTTITRACDGDDVAYVHIELSSHDIVLAEGAPAETFVPVEGRWLFQNGRDYAALYPDEESPAPVFVAPRLDSGEAVERVRRHLGAQVMPASGTLTGHVERIGDGVVEGWACDGGAGGLELELLADGVPTGRVFANGYRGDLDHHGLPACAFRASAPAGRAITLRRRDGTPLATAPDARAA